MLAMIGSECQWWLELGCRSHLNENHGISKSSRCVPFHKIQDYDQWYLLEVPVAVIPRRTNPRTTDTKAQTNHQWRGLGPPQPRLALVEGAAGGKVAAQVRVEEASTHRATCWIDASSRLWGFLTLAAVCAEVSRARALFVHRHTEGLLTK